MFFSGVSNSGFPNKTRGNIGFPRFTIKLMLLLIISIQLSCRSIVAKLWESMILLRKRNGSFLFTTGISSLQTKIFHGRSSSRSGGATIHGRSRCPLIATRKSKKIEPENVALYLFLFELYCDAVVIRTLFFHVEIEESTLESTQKKFASMS